MNGGRVSKRVGVDPLVRQSGRFLGGHIDVFAQQISNAEPGQRRAAVVQKDPLVSRLVGGWMCVDQAARPRARARQTCVFPVPLLPSAMMLSRASG
jgi:hypothetical protein